MNTKEKSPKKPVLKPKQNLKKSKPKQELEFDPNKHLIWSTKKIVLVVVLSVSFSIMLVFGFLASAQYRSEQIPDEAKKEDKGPSSPTKHYTNNYWGIELEYPTSWTQPIGSYADGEYYFASEPINFIGELENGEAIIALKTFNNWSSLPLNEWLKSQQWSFIPNGELSSPKSTTINGMPAQRYTLKLKTPQNNTSLWDMIIISRTTATKYVFILEVDNEGTQKKFEPDYEALLSSITYRKVESSN